MNSDPTGVLVSDAIAQYKSVKALAETSLTEDMLMGAVEALLSERGANTTVGLTPPPFTTSPARPAPPTSDMNLITGVSTGTMSIPEALDHRDAGPRVIAVAVRKALSMSDPTEFTSAVEAIANHPDTHPRMLKAFVNDERLDSEMRWALQARLDA